MPPPFIMLFKWQNCVVSQIFCRQKYNSPSFRNENNEFLDIF